MCSIILRDLGRGLLWLRRRTESRGFPTQAVLETDESVHLKDEKLCNGCSKSVSRQEFSFKDSTRRTATQSLVRYKVTLKGGQIQFPSARMAADRRNIRIVLEYLSQAACVDCGASDPLVLQFDHREPKTKDIASLVRSGCNSQRLIHELSKCEVRCANCHRLRTATHGGWFRVRHRTVA
jgi:hypothetical protein